MDLGNIDNHTLLIVSRLILFLMIIFLVIMFYLYRKINGLRYAIVGNICLIINNLLLDKTMEIYTPILTTLLTIFNLLGMTFLIIAIFVFLRGKICKKLYIIFNILNIFSAYYFMFINDNLGYRRGFLSLFIFLIFIDCAIFVRKRFKVKQLLSYKVIEFFLYVFSFYYFLRMIYSFTLHLNTVFVVDEKVLTSMTIVILIMFTIILTFGFAILTMDTLYSNLKHLSIKDYLTKLYNRRYIQGILRNLMKEVQRKERKFLIVFLDLDHFKKVNDTYGHNFGDQVLVWFSKLLRDNLRDVDIIGRYGGEEFIVILTDTSISDGYQTFERILGMANDYQWKHKGLKVTFSGSIMEVTQKDEHARIPELIDRVDKKMYQAKQEGRNRILIVEEDE